MANPLPNALALSVINDNDFAIASVLRNNSAAVQAAVNLLRAALAGGAAGQFLQAVDGTDVQWATIQKYRKTTAKVVANSVVETDLLNGEITVGAGVLGTNGVLRLTAWGDAINNTAATQATLRWKLKLGATTIFDSNIVAANWTTSANRMPWRVVVEIENLGAANSQWSSLLVDQVMGAAASAAAFLTTGEGTNLQAAAGGIADARVHGGGASAVDTTAAQVLALTITNPVANALLDVTLKGALVEVV